MKFVKYLFSFLFVLLIVVLIGAAVVFLRYANGLSVNLDELVHYKPEITTEIYDRNGELIANVFKDRHRLYARYDEIPPRMIEALIAIEDTVFFEHSGVNFEAILRAVMKDIKEMKLKEGASTLTQQLVKNRLLSNEKKLERKVKEAILAMELEQKLTKEQILERYLNEVYFGHRYYGIKTAARGYFRKDLRDLNLKEMAMLVGLPQAPHYYDPTRHLDISLARANTVLQRMHQLGWITDEELQKYERYRPKIYNDSLTQNRAPYIVDEVLRILQKTYPDIRTGGYKIYTTIDLQLQNQAKKSLKEGYERIIEREMNRKLRKDENRTDYSDLNGAIVVLENKTGEVLALVGGVDYEKSSFNRATRSLRQPGSSFKPFIYQTALDLGYSTQSRLADISRTFTYKDKDEEKEWKPKNYEKNFEGLITLREALVHSRNLATINLVNEIGLGTLHRRIQQMGFRHVPNDLSISLGTFGISPLEFAGFYTIFSNYGTKVEPLLIKSVTNLEGNTTTFSTKERNITTPPQAFLTISILEDVVRRGTGRKAAVKGIDLAGKTGTTNEYRDAWFCGFSPEIETIVWFGKDNNQPMHKETGGKAAAPVFRSFYEAYLKLHPETKRHFDIPAGVRHVKIKGRDEYFTQISKPPKEAQSSPSTEDGELLF